MPRYRQRRGAQAVWPWSKPKTEQERLAQRPAVKREEQEVRRNDNEMIDLQKQMLQIVMAFRGSDEDTFEGLLARYVKLAGRFEELAAQGSYLRRQVGVLKRMTPQEIYGVPKSLDEPVYGRQVREFEGTETSVDTSSADEMSPSYFGRAPAPIESDDDTSSEVSVPEMRGMATRRLKVFTKKLRRR